MVANAVIWNEDWKAKGNPDAARKSFHAWLAGEFYDSAPPRFPSKAKPKASPPPPPAPANDDTPPRPSHGLPVGRHAATIVTAEVRPEDGGTVVLAMTIDVVGKSWPHFIALEANDPQVQTEGQAEFERLQAALGVWPVEDAAVVVGVPFTLTVAPSGAIGYGAAEVAEEMVA